MMHNEAKLTVKLIRNGTESYGNDRSNVALRVGFRTVAATTPFGNKDGGALHKKSSNRSSTYRARTRAHPAWIEPDRCAAPQGGTIDAERELNRASVRNPGRWPTGQGAGLAAARQILYVNFGCPQLLWKVTDSRRVSL